MHNGGDGGGGCVHLCQVISGVHLPEAGKKQVGNVNSRQIMITWGSEPQ